MILGKLLGRGKKIFVIESLDIFTGAIGKVSTGPSHIEKIPIAVNLYSIPRVISSKTISNSIEITAGISGNKFAANARMIAQKFKESCIPIAKRRSFFHHILGYELI